MRLFAIKPRRADFVARGALFFVTIGELSIISTASAVEERRGRRNFTGNNSENRKYMAILAFHVEADYEQVVRLREEIARLKQEIGGVDPFGDKASFDRLNAQLQACSKELGAITDKAAQAGAEISSSLRKAAQDIDLTTPAAQLKAFDEQLVKLCGNIDSCFGGLQDRLQGMLGALGGGNAMAGRIAANGSDISQIEAMRQKNAELTEEIKRQQEEIQKQRDIYNQLAEAVRKNNVPAVQQATQAHAASAKELEAEARNIQALIDDNNRYAATLERKIAEQERAAESARRYADMNNAAISGNAAVPAGYSTDDIRGYADKAAERLSEANEKASQLREELAGVRQANSELNESLTTTRQQLEVASQKPVRMRTQIMLAREQLMQMIAAGQGGTPMFMRMARQAGEMRRQMALANAYMSHFANPARHLAALKTAMQGVAGSASLLAGIIGVFNSKSEKMAEIQTKIQSYLAIIVGLETTYAAVKKTSAAMTAISELQAWAEARASAAAAASKTAETGATIGLTVAQAAFNAVAKANTYLLLVSVISTVIGGIWLLVKALGSETEEQKKAAEASKRHAEELAKMNEMWANSVAESASKQIAAYYELQRKYDELGDSLNEKKRFVRENEKAFHDLGFSVNSVTDAENFFINNTGNVVQSLIARAEAAAYGELIKESIKKKIQKDEYADNTIAGGGYAKIPKRDEKIRVRAISYDPMTNFGVREVTRLRTDKEYNEAVAAAKRQARKKNAEIKKQNQKYFEQEQAYYTKSMKEAMQRGKWQEMLTGVPTYTAAAAKPEKKGGSSRRESTPAGPSASEIAHDVKKIGDDYQKAFDDLRLRLGSDWTDLWQKVSLKGTDLQIAQIQEETMRKKDAYQKQFNQLVEQRKKMDLDKWLKRNPGKKEYEYQPEHDNQWYRGEVMNSVMTGGTTVGQFLDEINGFLDQDERNEISKIERGQASDAESAWIEYLQTHGDIYEKRTAAEMRYKQRQKEIGEDESMSDKQRYAEQLKNLKIYRAELAELDLEDLKNSLNWEFIFGNLKNVDYDTLKIVREQLEKFIDTSKSLKPDEMRTVVNALANVKEQMDLSNPIKSIREASAEYSKAKKRFDKYKSAYTKAKRDGDTDGMKAAAKGMTKESKNMSAANEKAKRGFDAVTATARNYAAALGKAGGAISGVAGKCLTLASSAISAGAGMAEGIKKFGESAKALDRSVAVLSIVETALEAVNAITSLFGGADETLTRYVDTMSTYIKLLGESISDLRGNMDSAKNSMRETIAYYDQLVELRKQEAEAIKSQSQVWLNSGAGWKSHSEGYKIMDSIRENLKSSSADVRKFYQGEVDALNEYFKKATGRYARTVKDFGRMDWVWELSGDDMIALSKDTKALSILGDRLSSAIRDYASALKSSDELLHEQFASLLDVSYDDFYSDFLGMVSDMDKSSQDFASNFSGYMRKALIKNLVAKNFKDRLESIYEMAGKYAEEGTLKEHIRELRGMYKDAATQARGEVRMMDEIMGTGASPREASSKGFASMSQDSADELNGRFSALQIAGEQMRLGGERRNEMLAQMSARISAMSEGVGKVRGISDEIRTHLVNSYLELVSIRENTGAVVRPIKSMSEKIEKWDNKIMGL